MLPLGFVSSFLNSSKRLKNKKGKTEKDAVKSGPEETSKRRCRGETEHREGDNGAFIGQHRHPEAEVTSELI